MTMDLFTASIQSSYVDFPVSIVLTVYFIKAKKKKSSYVKKKVLLLRSVNSIKLKIHTYVKCRKNLR